MRRPTPRGPRSAALLLALTSILSAVPAAPALAALQWYQDYEQGLEAAAQRDWETALGHFRDAARVRREPAERVRTYGTRFLFGYDPLFQQARCLAELGRLEEARKLLAESEAAGVTDPSTVGALRDRLEALEAPRTQEASEDPSPPPDEAGRDEAAPPADALLTLRTTPAGADIRLDGRSVGATPLSELRVSPGRHRVELRRAGREPWSQEVDLDPGEHLRVDVSLASLAPPAEPAPSGGEDRREPVPTPATAEPTLASAAETATPAPAGGEVEVLEPPPGPADPPSTAASEPEPGEPPARRAPSVPSGALLGAGVVVVLVLALSVAGASAARRRRRGRRGLGTRELPGRIGRYRVTGELGRGGMATTYRAVRSRDGLAVAIKIPHETGDPTYLPRFLREGRLGETLHHPRIVRIVEAGEEEGRPFLAMELIPGRTLRVALDEAGGTVPLRLALEIARDVAEALDYAHGKGVVHRDLKPENVMLLPDGTVKVMDFGVARVEGQPGLTTSSFFFGSPVYAAPELVDPPAIDHRADLYSLGVILFELLQGRPPFHHESVFKLLEMHQREPLPDPGSLPSSLPDEVWTVLRRLLAKDPADRYAGAQELLVDLERLLYELPARARPSAEPEETLGLQLP